MHILIVGHDDTDGEKLAYISFVIVASMYYAHGVILRNVVAHYRKRHVALHVEPSWNRRSMIVTIIPAMIVVVLILPFSVLVLGALGSESGLLLTTGP